VLQPDPVVPLKWIPVNSHSSESFGWTLVTSYATIRGTRTNPQALESC
jgi:hypothetical protein